MKSARFLPLSGSCHELCLNGHRCFISKIILKQKTFFNFWVREVKEVSEDLVLIKCNLMDTKSLTQGSFCNKKF